MEYFNESLAPLASLGARLRETRLQRNDTMQIFAERIGVSVGTLRDMERGVGTVQIGAWSNALAVLGRLNDMDHLLAERVSLIDRARAEAVAPRRMRASRRKSART